MDQERKPYRTPELKVYGSVERITQNAFQLGTGDEFLTFLNHCDPPIFPCDES